MRAWLLMSCWLVGAVLAAGAEAIIAVGAGGEEDYGKQFAAWAAQWEKACAVGGVAVVRADEVGPLREAVMGAGKDSGKPLWVVLLGHGTADGREAKFNLRGDDLAASDLAEWLKPLTRPVVIVCGFSASGAFLKPLAAPGRVVVTATKSGAENNFSRLGGHLSAAITDAAADLDQDGQTSLLEAWLFAAQRTAEFYAGEGRLATEHSLLDDNGDGLGTPADFFRGLRAVKKPAGKGEADGSRAHQLHLVPSQAERALPPAIRQQRDALEVELARLRERKATMPETEYFAALEAVLLRLARVYRGEMK